MSASYNRNIEAGKRDNMGVAFVRCSEINDFICQLPLMTPDEADEYEQNAFPIQNKKDEKFKIPCSRKDSTDWFQIFDQSKNHPNLSSCYYISGENEQVAFAEAEKRCRNQGAELLTIETEEEDNQIDVILQVIVLYCTKTILSILVFESIYC